jgi:iron-sulfur cluster assembly accessory protein
MIGILVTAIALEKINEFMQERQPPPVGVRVFVFRDGARVSHSMSFTNDIDMTDEVLDIGGITFIVDPNSAAFLNNVVLDFVSVGDSSGFVFQDQCSTRSCLTCTGACGRSNIKASQ